MEMNTINLKEKSNEIRRLALECIHSIGVGHLGGCMSVVEVLACLYFGGLMKVDPQNPGMEGRDRLVVSKGHAGPAVYAALCSKGFFCKEQLLTLNQFGTNLPSHCDMNRTPGIDMTTGSLGQGFSCAVGIAIASRIKGDSATIYAIIGDGESQEGQIWEAAMLANQKKLSNLIAFTDYNKLQIDGTVAEVNDLGDIEGKWTSFGWHTQRVDGHDCEQIIAAVQRAKQEAQGPAMIILDTVKGKGVSFLEQAGAGNHNMPFGDEAFIQAMEELRQEV